MPLTTSGGFLGGGKTTLLNHPLAEHHGRRIAASANDFAALNIDARLMGQRARTWWR